MKKPFQPWLLFAAVMVPPGLFTVLNTSSMAAGGAVASLFAIACYPEALTGGRARGVRPEMRWSQLFCFFAVLHLLVASLYSPPDLGRMVQSLVLAVIYVFGGRALSMAFFEQSEARVHRTLRNMMITLVLLLPVAFMELIPSAQFGRNKIIFPYSEPSVYALGAMPFVAYMTVRLSDWRRVVFLLAAFALGAYIKNLTLIVGLLLVCSLCLRPSLLMLVLLLVGSGAATLDLTYFTSRLDLSSESENLSALVYVQGWQLIDDALSRTHGIGLGFQQLGAVPTSVPASDLIYAILGTELNLNDGGFVLAKLLTEFGVAGGLFGAWLLYLMVRSALVLRREAVRPSLPASEIMARCVLVCYGLDLFVRGSGYFTATSLLLLAAVQYLVSIRPSPVRRRKRGAAAVAPPADPASPPGAAVSS